LGLNALDHLVAAGRTLVSGTATNTLTQSAAGAVAKEVGASPQAQQQVESTTGIIQGLAGASGTAGLGALKSARELALLRDLEIANEPGSFGSGSAGAAAASTDESIAAHALKHWPKLTKEQLVERIGQVRATGTTIMAPNGNKITSLRDGTVLIDDATSAQGGTIFKPDDQKRFIARWLEENR
jgi:hypothetical protein